MANFVYVCQQVRRKLRLLRPHKQRKLPELMPEAELRKFFKVIQEVSNLQHEIMLKLLFFTALRVSELVKIRVGDIDFEECKIFVDQGKGQKDRYILFPESFRLVLKSSRAAQSISI
jgi:integrase/recombinase XerD